ncbi:hypothetical protein A9Q87_00770 [Flavobacteriales bacterium 34_180_T64]|nr:hypothetical protein A9Q87_00770 [Flavobacteriales bacterium 34_180_T64]
MLNIMELLKKIGRYRSLIIVLFLILCINIYVVFDENTTLFKVSKLIVIPIFLVMYFHKMKYMANVFFMIFVCFFLGDAFDVFNFSAVTLQLSMVLYIASYLFLIFVLLGKFKRVKFEGIVSLYLILIFILNSYFLYVLYDVVQSSMIDRINLVLIVARGISLLCMGFLAFAVYLSNESKQSIIFLAMSFCFLFSDVLYFVNQLYVYYWLFELFDKVLHLVGFALLFVYVTNHHRKTKDKYIIKSKRVEASENLIA